jgi:hypothetical protein
VIVVAVSNGDTSGLIGIFHFRGECAPGSYSFSLVVRLF